MNKNVYELLFTAEKLKKIEDKMDKLQETDLFQSSDELMNDIGEVIGSLNNLIDTLERHAERLITEKGDNYDSV